MEKLKINLTISIPDPTKPYAGEEIINTVSMCKNVDELN